MTSRLLPCGERAILVELDTLDEVLALHARVRSLDEPRAGRSADTSQHSLADQTSRAGASDLPVLLDLVPAARTLLFVAAHRVDVPRLRTALAPLLADLPPTASVDHLDESPPVEVPVRYDGEDLATVAQLTGLTPAEVVVAHTSTPWRAAFAGFAPGFTYLTGGDPRLQVPRRDEPRTAVPAGSVALAGEFSAVYPRSSPGGWQLLGYTDMVLFDTEREPPALLRPGALVSFVDADRAID